MKPELIVARIEQQIPGVLERSYVAHDGMLTLETAPSRAWELLKFLRDDEMLHFHFLTTLFGVHHPHEQGRELCVVYQLHNWLQNVRIRVKTFLSIEEPHLATVTNLWATADWMERETYDFFGIVFDGHPHLKRILNVEDLDVFPLRKEYRLEDGTRTDKDDRFFGRTGNEGRRFD